MSLADSVNAAIAALDAFINKETANEAEIASLKSQNAALTDRATAAEAALASAQANSAAAQDAANTAAADAAAVQPLLDKISALAAPVAPVVSQ